MTPAALLENVFFGYFFSFSDYLPLIFAFVLIVVLVFGFLNYFLGVDRRRP